MSSTTKEFGKIRSLLWPVRSNEHKKFIPMLVIFFLICFNYNILRATKDPLLLTAPSSGAEAIPFIKVWAILPMAIFMTYIFTRISNRYSKENVFYVMMSIFLGFFLVFSFVLYPLRDSLHPHAFADFLTEHLPSGFKGLIAIIRNWTYTSYYIMAEMWSTLIMTVLFWGFANDVTTVKEAKRFYGLLGISANLSGIISGEVSTYIAHLGQASKISAHADPWGQSLMMINMLLVVVGVACMILFRWLHKAGYGYRLISEPVGQKKKPKIRMNMRETFRYLSRSKYLLCVALIVLMYNFSINLIEVVWKDQVKQLYPNPNAFQAYMGQVYAVTGMVATLTSVFLTGNIIRRFNLTTSAMISPVILLTTGVGFFSFLLFKGSGVSSFTSLFGATPLAVGVFFGSMQNVFARASKYTLFDSTKELSFIPLSDECRLKGKAAIDGVGSRLGKSGGSVIHQLLLMVFGSLSQSTPFVAVILFGAIGVWITSIKSLGKQFNNLIAAQSDAQEAEEETPAPQAEEKVEEVTIG